MSFGEYIYRVAAVDRVLDGDTYRMTVDVGFHLSALISVRLYGYDCPEKHAGSRFEREQAALATREATAFLVGDHLWVQTRKDTDSFGRWLGDVWSANPGEGDRHLGEQLAARGLASAWPERWRTHHDAGT